MSEEKQVVIYDDDTKTMLGMAKILAGSEFVPAHYRGKVQDCFAAIQMARSMNLEPAVYMQHTQPIKGTISWKSRSVISMLNTYHKYEGGIRYETIEDSVTGDIIKRRVVMKEKETGELIKGPWVTKEMVSAEGWDRDKTNHKTNETIKSKWRTVPDVMYAYRSATFFVSLHCPEILYGHHTLDEIEDSNKIQVISDKQTINYSEVLPLEAQSDLIEYIAEREKNGTPDQSDSQE